MRKSIISGFVTAIIISVLCSACADKNKAAISKSQEYSENKIIIRPDSGIIDSDSDGITDLDEVLYVGSNQHKADTDDNGIDDYHDDFDSDGIINGEEVKLGTYAWTDDSDFDGVSDYDELYIYYTDPCEEDTDKDGADDLYEIEHGMNPLVADKSYVMEKSAGEIGPGTTVTVSVKMEVKNGLTDSFGIGRVTSYDNPFIVPMIAGYMGPGYSIYADGEFDKAELTFLYDTSKWTLSDKFNPSVYYFNDETKSFEELPDQVVEEGKVTVDVTREGIYVLLNKVEYDKVWHKE